MKGQKALKLSAGLSAIILAGCNLAEKQTIFAVRESGSTGKGISIPVNQILTPAGIEVELPEARPQVIALSPDSKLLATGGKHRLVLINPSDGRILQAAQLPSDNLRADETNAVSDQILSPDQEAQASYNGVIFAPDGKRIYLSNVH